MCDVNGGVKKPVVATGKPLLNTVSQRTPQFVKKKKKKGVTVSESSSDSASFQGITSQSKGTKPLRICEEEPKSPTDLINEFEYDKVDQIDYGKVNIYDNDHDSALFSLVDHDGMSGTPTTAELKKGSVQLKRDVEFKVDAFAEGMDTCETVSVNDQRVAHLSTYVNGKLELVIRGNCGGNLAVRQPCKCQKTTVSDAPLSSSTCITQSSVVSSSTMKGTPMNSRDLCYDYASIGALEKTKDIAQFSEDEPTVYERVIVKFTCISTGFVAFMLLFECYYLWCKLLCAHAWLIRYVVCLLVTYIPRYNDMGVSPLRAEDTVDRRRSANELCDDFPT
ncbi:unnamed protein product [Trichobilharzia regenti]|nr:unnamed protein product [Trichobilharzia regenti]